MRGGATTRQYEKGEKEEKKKKKNGSIRIEGMECRAIAGTRLCGGHRESRGSGRG
jgi:hypothetical protein